MSLLARFKQLQPRHRLLVGAVAALALLAVLSTCQPRSWKTVKMTPLSPRLQAALAKTQPYCFGRFVMDLPEGTIVAWGGQNIIGPLEIGPGRAAELAKTVAEVEAELKADELIATRQTESQKNRYVKTVDGVLPGMKVIVGLEGQSTTQVDIKTYFPLDGALVAIRTRVMRDTLEEVVSSINDVATRLRLRSDLEVPSEPGFCIENGFLRDSPSPSQLDESDGLLNVGFRLKEFADVHLSISFSTPTGNTLGSPSLKTQLEDSEADARKRGNFNLYGVLTIMRRQERNIWEWANGFEILTRTPNEKRSIAHPEAWYRSTGKPGEWLHPFVEVQMFAGVGPKGRGAVAPSLSDDEFIALWDHLTATIRPRPVAPLKTSHTDPDSLPLGTLAATGRICPQTGLWRCAEEGRPIQGGREQWLRQGELLPKAQVQGEPTLWQRLRGQVPTHAVATVWALVGYERVVPKATVPAEPAAMPPTAPPSTETSTVAPSPAQPNTLKDPSPKA